MPAITSMSPLGSLWVLLFASSLRRIGDPAQLHGVKRGCHHAGLMPGGGDTGDLRGIPVFFFKDLLFSL